MIISGKKTAIIMVCNGGKFITQQLFNIYNLVDEIIIIEGADNLFRKVIKSIRSTDNTLKLINDFNDIDHKIKLILGDFPDKNTIVKSANEQATGEFIYHIDIDEFLPKDIINNSFNLLTDYDCIKIPERWYYKWPDAYLLGGRDGGWVQNPGRFFRNKIDSGLTISHIPWSGYYAFNISGNDYKTKWKYFNCSIYEYDKKCYGYHYLALFKKELEDKMKYYVARGGMSNKKAISVINEFDSINRNDIGIKKIINYNSLLSLENNPFLIYDKNNLIINSKYKYNI
jgi:hypothetical protein